MNLLQVCNVDCLINILMAFHVSMYSCFKKTYMQKNLYAKKRCISFKIHLPLRKAKIIVKNTLYYIHCKYIEVTRIAIISEILPFISTRICEFLMVFFYII